VGVIEVILPCECGGRVIAHASNAGGTILCRCGRSVAVPNLSKLRTLAGKHAYVTNPVEAIRRVQQVGKSPAGDKCLSCGSSCPAIYRCDAVCESSHVGLGATVQPTAVGQILSFFVLGRILRAILSRPRKSTEAEVRGHDVSVTFKLPVCDACAATLGSVTRAAVAKQLMLGVPVYRDLLAYYPDLQFAVQRDTA
jgi:hypothetical protein